MVAARTVTKKDLELYDALAERHSRKSLRGYLDYVVVDSRPHRRRFKHTKDPWQTDLFEALIPAIDYATGATTEYDGPRAFFVVMGRGHAKTSTVAMILNRSLAYAANPIAAIAAAGDKDQAAILLERMQAEAKANPWLNRHLRHNNYDVHGPMGHLRVLSSDAGGAAGHHADVIIVDEITFHKKRDLFDMLFSGRHKRPNCVFIVIGNAGIKGTWQHQVYQEAKADPTTWKVLEVPAFSASWLDREEIEKDRKTMLPGFFKRVHLNEWVDDGSDQPYLERSVVEACVDHDHSEQPHGVRGYDYVLAMDYGAVKDRATAAVLHYEPRTKTVVLDKLWVHQGSKADRTPIDLMDEWANEALANFSVREFWLDPNQLEATAQRFERLVTVKRYAFQGSGHYKMAENLRNLFVNGRLKLYPDAGLLTLPDGTTETLLDELVALVVQPMGNQGAYRFDHVPGKHDDRTTSLALGALAAVSQRQRFDVHEVLDSLLKPPAKDAPEPVRGPFPEIPEKETTMVSYEYKQIRHVAVYATWQAVPVIDGTPVPLGDYGKKDEAAAAVNAAHELIGNPPPNDIPAAKQPNAAVMDQIRNDVKLRLSQRGIKPKAKPAVASKEAKS